MSPRKGVRKLGVAAVGGSLVALGLVLMPLPGPGTVLVLGGLSLLQTEYAWAGRLLRRLRAKTGVVGRWVRSRGSRSDLDS
ncbi:MAG: PGPGW domain-containing protein [Acidimicrobiia bacterium]|nr:PGPGW domain-containing protein [Acidimicrobiia bacterium]